MSSETIVKNVDVKVRTPGAAQAKESLHGIGHALHEMNAEARRGSAHGIETLLKGGGALAAVHFGFEAAAEGAKKWREDLALGDKSYMGLVVHMLESLPIIHSVVSAIEELKETWHDFHMSDEERKFLREQPGRKVQQAKDEALAMSLKTKGQGFENQDFSPTYQKRKDLTESIGQIQEAFKNHAVSGTSMSEAAEIDFELAFEKLSKEYYANEAKIRKGENSFVKSIRFGLEEFSKDFWVQVGREFEATGPLSRFADDTVTGKVRRFAQEYADRQNDIDLDSWRATAETRKNFEDTMMTDRELANKHEREFWNGQAADERLTDDQRKLALKRANAIGGFQPGGYAPSTQGYGLTGAHAAGGELAGADAQAKTAKNTEKTAKAAEDSAAALKDIAAGFKKNPGIIFGLGL